MADPEATQPTNENEALDFGKKKKKEEGQRGFVKRS